jgi:hypothetical protein
MNMIVNPVIRRYAAGQISAMQAAGELGGTATMADVISVRFRADGHGTSASGTSDGCRADAADRRPRQAAMSAERIACGPKVLWRAGLPAALEPTSLRAYGWSMDNEPDSTPLSLAEALDESLAEIERGVFVPAAQVHGLLQESIARLEAKAEARKREATAGN